MVAVFASGGHPYAVRPSRIFSVQVIRFDGPIVTGYNYLASRTSPFHTACSLRGRAHGHSLLDRVSVRTCTTYVSIYGNASSSVFMHTRVRVITGTRMFARGKMKYANLRARVRRGYLGIRIPRMILVRDAGTDSWLDNIIVAYQVLSFLSFSRL